MKAHSTIAMACACAISVWSMAARAQEAAPATLYKCKGSDGVLAYVSKPITGAECVVVGTYRRAGAGIGTSPPSILGVCRDAGTAQRSGLIGTSPSAKAKECTRIYCETPALKAKVRRYALSEEQSQSDQLDALACLTRREQDAQRRQ